MIRLPYGYIEFGGSRAGREANARRVRACWDACEGVATEGIEALAQAGGVAAADAIMKKTLAEFQEMKRDIEDEWTAACKLRTDLAAARALLEQVMPLCVEVAEHATITERISAFLKGGA